MGSFLADEDFDHRIASSLRQQGHDILTLGVLGLAGASVSDERIIALAHERTRAVLTHNRRHFVRLHRQGLTHSGIVISSHARDAAAQALRIHQVITGVPALAASLVRVNLNDHTIE
jgi:hypothetical protein